MRVWLVSPAFDLGLMILPALIAVIVAFALPTAALSPLGWLLLVLCVDVAHVYASLYRTYLDAAELKRHPARYALTPLLVAVAGITLYGAAPGLYWTVLAYIAVFHFVRQQVGVTALYRLVEGAPYRGLEASVERALVYALTLFPILWWHAHLPRAFSWFMPGDFLSGLPDAVLWPAGLVTAALALTHGIFRIRSGRVAWGRDLWVGVTALAWFGGIVLTNGDLAFTATNVILHGVPYMALVGVVGARQWALTGAGPVSPTWFGVGRRATAALFVLPLIVLAFGEEGLWDALVWHDNVRLFGEWSPQPGWEKLAIPLLSVPQVTHYLLDGLIWRLGPPNPALRSLLQGRDDASIRPSEPG